MAGWKSPEAIPEETVELLVTEETARVLEF